jgi:hypothetical protein
VIGRWLRRAAALALWLADFGLLIYAADHLAHGGSFLPLIGWAVFTPLAYWGMRRIDREGWTRSGSAWIAATPGGESDRGLTPPCIRTGKADCARGRQRERIPDGEVPDQLRSVREWLRQAVWVCPFSRVGHDAVHAAGSYAGAGLFVRFAATGVAAFAWRRIGDGVYAADVSAAGAPMAGGRFRGREEERHLPVAGRKAVVGALHVARARAGRRRGPRVVLVRLQHDNGVVVPASLQVGF